MGKWKCLWCSKVLEGESFMDLVAASMRKKDNTYMVGNVTPVDIRATAVLKNKLASV